ncbi:hypothetical protein G6F57_014505 [Rhizopus arrhizus]|nr:hypothetical protein G6F65_020876 [Rhizopus arrhizus]KAG1459453.1 hypothetical protein G6F57_014505 [Rhizopus arrhizus]
MDPRSAVGLRAAAIRRPGRRASSSGALGFPFLLAINVIARSTCSSLNVASTRRMTPRSSTHMSSAALTITSLISSEAR